MSVAEVHPSDSTIGTINQSTLSVVAQQIVQPDGARACPKDSIIEWKGTDWVESKLPASNSGIKGAPKAITDRPPSFVDADFDTTLHVSGSIDQSQSSIFTQH